MARTPPDEARLRLAPVPTSVGAARRFVRATLAEWERDDLEDTVTLLVSELITNVVLHAGTPAEMVLLRLDARVRAEVHDLDRRTPHRKVYGLEATTGRGLGLVATLADEWGVTAGAEGKLVWFEVGVDALNAEGTERRAVAPSVDAADVDLRQVGHRPAEGGRRDERRGPGRPWARLGRRVVPEGAR